MSNFTGQLGTFDSFPGELVLGLEGCDDFFTGELGTSNSMPGGMVLGVANYCEPPNQGTVDPFNQAASNAFNINHTLTKVSTYARSVSNTITFVQVRKPGHVRSNSIFHTIIFVGSSKRVKLADATNTITFTHTNDVKKSKGASNTLNLVQTMDRLFIFNRTFISTFQVVDVPEGNYVRNIFIGESKYDDCHTSQLGIVDSRLGHMLLGSDEFCVPLSFGTPNDQSKLFINQNVNRQMLMDKHLFHIFSINSQALRSIRLFASSMINFTNSGTLFKRSRNQTVSNQLVLTQNVQRTVVYTRSASHTFGVKNGYQRFLPGIGVIQDIPGAIGVITNCFVLLEATERSIVLPCPRFDDSQEWAALNVILKRSILGDTRTYVDRSGLAKLKYSFWLGRLKSLELRQFLLDFIDDYIVLTNYKGEVWLVKFSTSTAELVPKMRFESERERIDVVLDFEGVKLF